MLMLTWHVEPSEMTKMGGRGLSGFSHCVDLLLFLTSCVLTFQTFSSVVSNEVQTGMIQMEFVIWFTASILSIS